MAWDATKPAGADKIKDSDDALRANFADIETVLGTNITAGPTTIQGAIQGDTTKGRKLRGTSLLIDNGTNGISLKCTVTNRWNGDTIAETDDIVKNDTTGDFSLSAGGTAVTIEATGLTGNCLYAIGQLSDNNTTVHLLVYCLRIANDIYVQFINQADGVADDITTLVDTGTITVDILYITDA